MNYENDIAICHSDRYGTLVSLLGRGIFRFDSKTGQFSKIAFDRASQKAALSVQRIYFVEDQAYCITVKGMLMKISGHRLNAIMQLPITGPILSTIAAIVKGSPYMWDSKRVGAGAPPIRTGRGWLEIYHGANSDNRYCLGALLLDINDPSKVLARSIDPIMEPIEAYEQTGFFGNVVFTNGHYVKGDDIYMYYGASDEVICGAKFSIKKILKTLIE